jgi:membrane-bound lytic murein transglycosylase B
MKGDPASPGGHTLGPEPTGPERDASRRLVRLPRRLLAVIRRRKREPARSRPAWLDRPLTARGLPMLALLLAVLTLPSSLPAGLAGGLDSGAATDEAARALGLSLEEWNRLHEQAWQRGRQAAGAAGQQPVAEAVANGPGAATPSMLALPQGGDHMIPALALRAYHEAAAWAVGFRPGCGLSWSVLAGIGRLESNHGMHWGSATRFSPDGMVSPPITGPALNGRGVASIPDTDGGRWDGDRTWDRAVGPMQFIPSTWRRLGRDGNGDRVADPNNLFDAATSAAGYLCLIGGDLSGREGLRRAVYGYNHSWAYVDAVLRWASLYEDGVAVGPAMAAGPPGAAAAPPSGPSPRPGQTTASVSSTTRRPGPTPSTARAAPGPSATTSRPTSSSATTTSMTTSTTTLSMTTTTTPSTTTGPCATTTTSTTTTAPTTTTLPPCFP